MEVFLTTKEITLLADLLSQEELACKKAGLYSRILTNPKLAEQFKKLAEEHRKRFLDLMEML